MSAIKVGEERVDTVKVERTGAKSLSPLLHLSLLSRVVCRLLRAPLLAVERFQSFPPPHA